VRYALGSHGRRAVGRSAAHIERAARKAENDQEAARLYKLAADQGNALAQSALARLTRSK
jgi:TPR repeat protein